jgi:phosphoribosylformylglycinamidine synthase subunit PurSL
MIHEVRVTTKGHDPRGADVLREIEATLGIRTVRQVRSVKVYRLEGIRIEEAEALARTLLCNAITQTATVNVAGEEPMGSDLTCVEVAYKPGVMNPEAASILKAARDCDINTLLAADSSWEYQFAGSLTEEELQRITDRLLVNKTVEQVVTHTPTTLRIGDQAGTVEHISLTVLTDPALEALSRLRSLFLTVEEMRVIRQHFRTLEREPTDAELETLAQTWSEHCGHKTFKARLIVDGQEKEPLITRLMNGARTYGTGVLSSFVDNSGVIAFFDGYAICGKVETHNSPSAIEPYGGAMTGSGGVFRDIMGTGHGAKVIVSTDMFCFAPPDLPAEELPPGCLPPRYLLRKVVAGVRDYGNRMGIPTNNGSVHFHPDFRAKPSVIVGSYGVLPADRCQKGVPQPGDLIIVVGGRTGRDGIHGATFSSGEMTAQTVSVNASAVQIGNAIEEKRMADALLHCRDEGLIRAITDCGAGGFASAIGEMGSRTGVSVALERAPLKYPGLAPWEIWLSESQERMVIAVAPDLQERVLAICRDQNVEATVLGVFTDDQRLVVTYGDTAVCDLSMGFLHEGLPQRTMVARKKLSQDARLTADVPCPQTPEAWIDAFQRVLAHGNVCSKEPIVRMYDHGVQGTSALPPFSGAAHDGPNDAVVIRPLLDKPYGLIVAHGLNPILNRIDPYAGSLWAAVEALSNYAAVGGNVREAALIDNFIWPFPDEESLWDLDQAVEACLTVMNVFRIPFVSGKDSLSSTYRRDALVLKIPPVLCISAFGKIPDVTKTVTADFKKAGSYIVRVGRPDAERLGGSVYYDIHGVRGEQVPQVDLNGLPSLFDWLHGQIAGENVLACHDISEGGMAATLAEMCFGGNRGAQVSIPWGYGGRLDHWFFNETAGCFLLEVPRGRLDTVAHSALQTGLSRFVLIGMVMDTDVITLTHHNSPLFSLTLDVLKESWKRPMKEIFH